MSENNNRSGGYNRDNKGGYNREGSSRNNDRDSNRGGFNKDNNRSSGGYNNRGPSSGGPRKFDSNRNGDRPRQSFKVICSECNKETDVPFKPTEGRPVYCRDCFAKHKPQY